MALFVMIIRKMIKNKWLELSLALGLILSVALVGSMPIYKNAILQRMLVKDLENLQLKTGQYPGIHNASIYFNGTSEPDLRQTLLRLTDQFMREDAGPGFGLPILQDVRERSTNYYKMEPADPQKVDPDKSRGGSLAALEGLGRHIKLIDGRMPADEPVNGVYEALVVDKALTQMKMVLNNVFVISDDEGKPLIKVKPVGVIEKKRNDDLFFLDSHLSSYSRTLFIPFDLFEKDFTRGHILQVQSSNWYQVLDYTKMDLTSVHKFLTTNEKINLYFYNKFSNFTMKVPALDTINTYFERENNLRTMLWSLNVPVMIMLGFYLYMVSNLIIERQKTEIAVLRSRGASRWQIVAAYFVEGCVLGAIAFVTGPYVGLFFTEMLGASNGFLEFVQRKALHVELSMEVYKYTFYAVLASLVMMLIPALLATRVSIVGHKQQMARTQKKTFWHKFYLDMVLIAIAIYGLSNFRTRMKDLVSLGLDFADLNIDPLLFLVPALFIVGMGLFILRIYPWFIRLIYWAGRRYWPPSIYSTLTQVGRTSSQYQFLMVFLIITMATGLFSASAARTLNQNTEDQIRYKNGADLVMTVKWENDAPPPAPPGMEGMEESTEEAQPFQSKKPVQYTEPPFDPLTKLPGVEEAAKVFVKDSANFSVGQESGIAKLMGIETDIFGRTAWFRDGILDHHFYNYLNLIATDSSAVLISKTLADQKGVKPGDPIYVGWNGVEAKPFMVYGIIDYFPTFNPNPAKPPSDEEEQKAPMLIVGHLDAIQNRLALEPYEVWFKLKPDASRQALYDELANQNIPIVELKDTMEEIIQSNNDPFRLAVNGVMTLGFLISIIVSFFGFLLYWILSLHGRILQFGIFRAMGISFRQLIGMLITEQLLTSGAGILIGVLTGTVTGYLFVPMFQIAFNPSSQVPPFHVIFETNDSMQLYMIVAVMLVLGLFILGTMLSRIKIHQAVKLGED